MRPAMTAAVVCIWGVAAQAAPQAMRETARAQEAARMPSVGTDSALDIGSWNVEWFGAERNGPRDDTLQQDNVRAVIASADVDIWGLTEVVSVAAFNRLVARLPGYAGLMANSPRVANGPAFYAPAEQKLALIYRTAVASLTDARLILTGRDQVFAGRPPLEARFRVTVRGATREIVVIVVHLKAFSDPASWRRRATAAAALKEYLDAAYPVQQVFVIGDWNDDTDTSIARGRPTPFADFVSDSARYRFPTAALSAARVASTLGYPEFIDHHLTTNEAYAACLAPCAEVVRADRFIARYRSTTTDHLPVVTHYAVRGSRAPPK